MRLCSSLLLLALWLPLASSPVRANLAADLARIHLEATGGVEAHERLRAFTASGHTRLGDAELPFVIWAAAPNRVRIETLAEGRRLVRAYDGEAPPWMLDEAQGGARPLPALEIAGFVADAEFHNALHRPEERGISLDYAGRVEHAGRTCHRLLVTRRLTEVSWLFLDAETFMLVRSDTERRTARGGAVRVETHFDDFRPVAGVLMPHRIETWASGQRLHVTVLDEIDPNPALPVEFFSAPTRG